MRILSAALHTALQLASPPADGCCKKGLICKIKAETILKNKYSTTKRKCTGTVLSKLPSLQLSIVLAECELGRRFQRSPPHSEFQSLHLFIGNDL